MKAFCEKNSMSFDEYEKKLLSDYGVSHKKDMSDDDLKIEIERHKV